MIVNRVSRLMGERRMGVTDLSRATGLAYATCYQLYAGTSRRVDFGTLDALCRHFECGVGDLFEYVPDSQPQPIRSEGT
jgi:putative transcriptional regulator